MPKRKRREQHHLRQQSVRRKNYTMGGVEPAARYKPGFPMNLLGNVKFFAVVGVVVAVIMVGSAILSAQNRSDTSKATIPTPTATPTVDPNATATPVPSATPAPKQFAKAEQVIDAASKQYTATVKTDKGDIVLKLFADKAPNTVNSFVFLAKNGFFDGITVHRVSKDFVIQAGDPTSSGNGGPGYETEIEVTDLKNTRGSVSMARAGTSTKFGSQFFIDWKDNPALDQEQSGRKPFYPFAEVASGMDVVDAINKVQTDSREKPLQPITIVSVTIEEKPR